MGYRKYTYNVKSLRANPLVQSVTDYDLIFTPEFMLQMFQAWKKHPTPNTIRAELQNNGLLLEDLASEIHKEIHQKFYSTGYPPSYSMVASVETHPLILSGLYFRSRLGGISINKEQIPVIFSNYPSASITECLLSVGIDPLDVGKVRISQLKKACQEYLQIKPENKKQRSAGPAAPDPSEMRSPFYSHYIESTRTGEIQANMRFYNEASFLKTMPLAEILDIYGLSALSMNTSFLQKTGRTLQRHSPVVMREEDWKEAPVEVHRKRIWALQKCVEDGFRDLGLIFARLDTKRKRELCQQIHSLPSDPMGFFNSKRILALFGIPKSTYYALLNNKDYGRSAERRFSKEEADIQVIREVLAYKGFGKGIRQVFMLMPKITHRQMSIYRIRTLMKKNGIRTMIRRPSRSRKATKELIARNRKANLLMRKFRMHRPNEVRLTDVTYLDYGDDLRAYGSASVDPVTGRLICFIVSENNDLQLALDTLEAMDEHPAKSGAVLHSDQGMLYMTDDFQAAVVEKKLTQSMSRRGNCWDNAPQESFFGHFKDECHYGECRTLEELRSMISGYAVYYNTERGMWEKDRMTPEEYEKYLEAMDETQWQEHLAEEEERYLEMKEASAAKAVEGARQYRNEIEERLEEMKP